MKRSVIRDPIPRGLTLAFTIQSISPDSASLHPGYASRSPDSALLHPGYVSAMLRVMAGIVARMKRSEIRDLNPAT